jgi:DNA-binding MarR family transcriptional regulator
MAQPTEALDRLLHLTRLVAADMDRELPARGLTQARAHVLWVLGANDGCTQRVLAERVGVTPRTMTGLVDALEVTGFVRRAAHPTDRRATAVTLTPKGRDTVDWLVSSHEALAELLFGEIPTRRRAALVRELREVGDRLEAAISQARAEQGSEGGVAGG